MKWNDSFFRKARLRRGYKSDMPFIDFCQFEMVAPMKQAL